MLAKELEVLTNIRTGIKAPYYQAYSLVHQGGSMSAAFDINMGEKQGHPASLSVFCLFLGRVQDFIAVHAPPFCHAHTPYFALLATFILLYADDLVLITNFPGWLQKLLHAFTHFVDANGMHIS